MLSVRARVDSYDDGAGAGQRQPVRQRHRDLHQRRRRGPAVPARGRGRAWSASTCRSRCRWRTTRSAAGRRRCSATPTCTAPRACTSSPAARSSPALARPAPRRRQPGLPHERLTGVGVIAPAPAGAITRPDRRGVRSAGRAGVITWPGWRMRVAAWVGCDHTAGRRMRGRGGGCGLAAGRAALRPDGGVDAARRFR